MIILSRVREDVPLVSPQSVNIFPNKKTPALWPPTRITKKNLLNKEILTPRTMFEEDLRVKMPVMTIEKKQTMKEVKRSEKVANEKQKKANKDIPEIEEKNKDDSNEDKENQMEKDQDEDEEDNESKEDTLNPASRQDQIRMTILQQRLSRQQDQIDNLLIRIKQLENKKQTEPLNQKAWSSIRQEDKMYKPAVNIEMDGNTMLEPATRKEQPKQPLDFVKVKTQRKFHSERPKLSESLNTKVHNALDEQKVSEEKNSDPSRKQRQEKYITADERKQKIEQMFAKLAQYIGMAPFTKSAINKATENMTTRGIFQPKENYEQRRQRTIKSMIETWTRQNLKMTDEDWDDLKVLEILPSTGEDSDVIFMNINSKACNLPKSNQREAPCLIMHVDNRARKRVSKYCTNHLTTVRWKHPNFHQSRKTRLFTKKEGT